MKHLLISRLVMLITVSACVLPVPSLAQFDDIRQHLNSLPTERVVFDKGATSTTIQNATNTIYILRAKTGQTLTLKLNSAGGPASVTLYGVDGKPFGSGLSGQEPGKSFSVRLTETGDYYIAGGSGWSNALYNFTVTIR